jgi:hypothetical protein
VIKGHTDSIGKKSYNMRLSRARAKSLRQYLINKFGIDGSRIATIDYGPNKPIASNDTEEGRQKTAELRHLSKKLRQSKFIISLYEKDEGLMTDASRELPLHSRPCRNPIHRDIATWSLLLSEEDSCSAVNRYLK